MQIQRILSGETMKEFKINRHIYRLLVAGVLVVLSFGLLFCIEASPQRPNIVLIMSDDMGYSDIGCYGGEINTPNLDKLAANGLRSTQFYNTSRCCPTRASLLTGLYPHQTGIGHMTDAGHKIPAYQGDLNSQCMTIAEVLKLNGYSTYIAYDLPWANASNTPFKLYKHWVHEGGISTPLIVHWPQGIKSKNELRSQPGHLIDIMATCVDAAGADNPHEYNGNQIIPMEGRSLLPAFENKPIDREALF
jgi:arylsulfatase A-like enzyme